MSEFGLPAANQEDDPTALGRYLLPAANRQVTTKRRTTGTPAEIPNKVNALADADWLMGAVLASGPLAGALCSYVDQQHVAWYQDHFGAIGLARATEISGDSRYVNAAWNHCDSYAAHRNADGHVHDWDLISGTWTERPNSVSSAPYDSVDSYPALFLIACRAAWRASAASARLTALSAGITAAVTEIRNAQQSDGLTQAAPPFYLAKLLEDNCETYQGLRAAADLATVLGNSTLASQASSSASSMLAGIETMWSAANNYYYWAKATDGVLQPTNWAVFQPDAMEQGWAATWGVTTVARGQNLLNQIDTHFPLWEVTQTYDATSMGWGYRRNGLDTRADAIAATIRGRAIASSRAWPFNSMSCGELIVLETHGDPLL